MGLWPRCSVRPQYSEAHPHTHPRTHPHTTLSLLIMCHVCVYPVFIYFVHAMTDISLHGCMILPSVPSAADAPKYSWRGMMIDTSRHWIEVPKILQLLDGMCVLQLHGHSLS